ncbi:TPA: distal tail protein Dit [Streptococcus suis]
MIKMNFNNVDFSRWLVITKGFTTFGGADFDVATEDVGLNGTRFIKNRYKEKIIRVPFYIEYKQLIDYDAFEKALYVTEPQKLTFSHQPHRYYYAIPTGDLDFDEFRMNGKGTLTFIVPDGVAHSTVYRSFNTTTTSIGKTTIALTNNGTVDAPPIIRIKHNAENGYIGIVNQTGAFELGNPEEADTEVVKQSEVLFDYRDSKITDGLTASAKNVAILNDTYQNLVGTVASVDWSGRKHLFLQNAGGTTGNNAGSLTWDIPADSSGATGSLNDYIWWRQIFWLGATNQYGFIKLTVSDTNGQFLYGVETFKRAQGLGCEYNFMASDGNGGYKMIKRWTFNGTHENAQNPFNEPRGASDLKRNDDKVRVYWFGSYNDFVIPEIKGRKSAKIHVAFGAIGNKPLVSRMYLDGIYYRKDFVSVTKDIPNTFSIGSEVEVNFENDKVWIDGKDSLGVIVDGSDLLTIPTGESELELYFSSWTNSTPEVTVEFEERWL